MLQCFFYFDGKSSREFNLKIYNKQNEDTTFFGINRNNNIEIIPNSHKAYCLGSRYEPLTFKITLWSDFKPMGRYKRGDICKWLFKDNFCELYSECEPDTVYYCKLSGDASRFLAAGETGYLELTVQCDSPFAWSRVMKQQFDLREELNLTFPKQIQIRNDSNYEEWNECIFKMKLPGSGEIGDIKIWNKTNSLEEDTFVLSSSLGSFPLQYGEYLQIDMNTGEIYTDAVIGVGELYAHRRKNTNKKFITLDYGINEIEFTGNCQLEILTQYPVLR